jgi:hypothetical protein
MLRGRAVLVFLPLFLAAADAGADEARAECVAASTEGQALRDEGKLARARERLAVCARDECGAVVQKYCAEWLADVDRRVPTVVVKVQTSYGLEVTDAKVTIDGRAVTPGAAAVPLDPGDHVVHAERPGALPVDAHVLLSEGEKDRLIDVRFPGPPPTKAPYTRMTPESQHLLPLATSIALVAGVAGVSAFAYLGLDASHEVDHLRTECAPHCTQSQVDGAKHEALGADVCLGVGLVALGIAAYTYLRRDPHEAPPATAIDVGPTRGGAVGSVAVSF